MRKMLDTKITTMDVNSTPGGLLKETKEWKTQKYFNELKPDKRYKLLNEYTLKRLACNPGESFTKPRWDLREEFLQFYEQIPQLIDGLEIPKIDYEGNLVVTKKRNVFQYLEYQNTKETMQSAYSNIIKNFLCNGVRVADL